MKGYNDQSSAMSRAMLEQWRKTKSGIAGLGTSMIAEPIAGLNALIHNNPDLVHSTREHLTYGNPAGIVPNNFMMPEFVNQGAEYFNESADKLGAYSPALGAALKTAPAFVAAMAAPELRGEAPNPNNLRKFTEAAEKADKAKRVKEAVSEGGGHETADHETPDQKRLRLARIKQQNNERAS